MSCQGKPFHAMLHSTDASSGVAVPLYLSGDSETYTLKDWEYLEVHSVKFVSAAGGDSYLNVGDAAGSDADETVFRGTFDTNGGLADKFYPPYAAPGAGGTLWLTAPAGAVDIVVAGTVRNDRNQIGRPDWRANTHD